VARSFARIHETNLKKQGVLPIWFANSDDYARIPEGALISTRGLVNLSPGSKIWLAVEKDGKKEEIECKHTMSGDQIAWFKAGSALNAIRDSQ
jgi:homoaconitase